MKHAARGGSRIAWTLVACLALVAPTYAQESGRGRGQGPGGQLRPAAIMERIEKGLAGIDLTREQKDEINSILTAGRQQMRGTFQEMSDGQPAARRGRMQEMSDTLIGKIRAVMTPEQTKTFDLQLAQANTPLPVAPTTQPESSPQLAVVLERLRDYLDQLELNSDQKLRLEGLFTDTRAKLRELQSRGGDVATISQRAQTIVQQLRQQINSTLTPQQLQQFREIVAQNGPVMPGGRGGRAGRGRANAQAMPQNSAPGMQGMQDMQGTAGGMQNDMAGGMQGGMQNDMSMGGANRGNATAAMTPQPTPEIPMLEVGATAPDFELKKLEGTGVSLASLKGKLVLVVFGSYSSPSFRQRAEALETLRRDYGARITPIIVYTRENHPVGEWDVERNKDDGVAVEQPTNMEGRITVAKQARTMLKLTMPIAVDTMEDTTAKAYGGMTNAAFLIGRDGKIVARQKWFEPYGMRRLIDEALKEPAKSTS